MTLSNEISLEWVFIPKTCFASKLITLVISLRYLYVNYLPLSLSLSRSKKRVIISAFISHEQKRDNRAYYEIMNLFAIISNRMPERIVCSRLSLSQLPFLCIPFFGVFLRIFINIMISQN